MEYPFEFNWRNNDKRASYKGRACRIVASGSLNSVLIEFIDGERMITSWFALKKKSEAEASLF